MKMETAHIEKIVTNTEKIARNPKPKTYIFLHFGLCIRTKFGPVIELDKNKKYEMAQKISELDKASQK